MTDTDHAPPPLFRRGLAPLAMLTLYLALSLSLFIVDLRFRSVELVRKGLSLVVDPAQRVAQTPRHWFDDMKHYFVTLEELETENRALRHQRLLTSPELLRLEQMSVENERLRQLLAVKQREKAEGQVAEILYASRDPFSRRVVVDKGKQAGVDLGQSVIDDKGVVGQVTRIFPFSAEITLITDKDQAVPVQIVRNGQRSVVFGLGNGQLELRYIPLNADVRVDDVLVTSGLDHVYLPGFPVAKVVSVDHDPSYPFTRILCMPLAAVENFGEVMMLNQREPLPPPPPEGNSRAPTAGHDVLKARQRRQGKR